MVNNNIKRSVGQPKKPNNILYQRRFDKSLVTKMDEYLNELKKTCELNKNN